MIRGGRANRHAQTFRWWDDAQLHAVRRADRTGRRHKVRKLNSMGLWLAEEVGA